MHTMFVHPNFPSQFGHLALALSRRPGDEVTFVTSCVPNCGPLPFDVVSYRVGDRPVTDKPHTGRNIQEYLTHAESVLAVCASLPDLHPDVVVGHASFGTWLYLRALYNARFVTYFEYLPPPYWKEQFSLRPDYPPSTASRAVNATFHALNHLHLDYCDAAYTPTLFQWLSVPEHYGHKVSIIHDGVDTKEFRKLRLQRPYTYHGIKLDRDTHVVTYLSRGLESFRGFDVFMKAMLIVCQEMSDCIALVVGGTANYYGHDLLHTDGMTFKDYVLSRGDYPLDRIRFLGTIPPSELSTFFTLSDCHVYLTVPWVLSWSCVQAMACECPMVVSSTEPLLEVIDHGTHGLTTPFYSHEQLAANILWMLNHPDDAEKMGRNARQRIETSMSVDVCVPKIIKLLEGS